MKIVMMAMIITIHMHKDQRIIFGGKHKEIVLLPSIVCIF